MIVDGLTILIFVLGAAGLFLLLRPLLAGAAPADVPVSAVPPGPLARFLAKAIPQPALEIAGIGKELRRAGYYDRHDLVRYLSRRNALLLGVVVWGAGAVAGVISDARAATIVLVVAFVLFAIVYGVPRLYLQSLANRRVDRILQGLPDALDMVTMSLSSGLPLREAIPHVGQEIAVANPDLAKEFEIIQVQAEAGSLTQALRQFADRTEAPDIRSLAAVVGQTERLGTNVAGAIREYADSVRNARRQRAEERASKLSIKMLFPIILCLSPPVYIVLCGPAVLDLTRFITRQDNRPGTLMPPPPILNRPANSP